MYLVDPVAPAALSDSVVIALITAGAAVVVALVSSIVGPIILNGIQKRRSEELKSAVTKQVNAVSDKVDGAREAVTNEHAVHLRDDLDQRFGHIDDTLKTVRETLTGVIETQEQQSSQLGNLFAQNKSSIAREKKRDRVVSTMGKGIIGVRTDVSTLFDNDADHVRETEELRRAIEDLEKTTPKSALPKP